MTVGVAVATVPVGLGEGVNVLVGGRVLVALGVRVALGVGVGSATSHRAYRTSAPPTVDSSTHTAWA